MMAGARIDIKSFLVFFLKITWRPNWHEELFLEVRQVWERPSKLPSHSLKICLLLDLWCMEEKR